MKKYVLNLYFNVKWHSKEFFISNIFLKKTIIKGQLFGLNPTNRSRDIGFAR